MTSSNTAPFDVIIFGATSFVGEILCSYMVERHGISGADDGQLSWAVAGRSKEKLQSVVDKTGADVEQIVADAADAEAMAQLAQSARIVVSTVGPYALYGNELVAACAASGTDYCDLTGEPQWMQRMIDTHHDAAVASGARIVHTCGFDSIPSDVGVWFTQQQAHERFGDYCSTIAMRVKAMKGGVSGGTVASMMNMMEEMAADPSLRSTIANPYALAPADRRTGVKQPNVTVPTNDEASGQWVAPFVMAGINTKVVHRSHALADHPWGSGFQYDEAMMMGAGPAGAAKAAATTAAMGASMGAAAVGPVRKLLNQYVVPKPGSGPSPDAQEKGFFDLRFYGTAGGNEIVTKVTGDRDPGYGSTAKMLAESATTLLATERTDTPGGFWTPSTAMGQPLIDALVAHAGLTFEVL